MPQATQSTVEISRILRFQPVRLLVVDVGLFNEPFFLDLIDSSGSPANIFLIASPNGLGKTTLLTTFASVFECLYGFEGNFRQEDLNSGRGYAQLDAVVDVEVENRRVVVGLSVCCGGQIRTFDWNDIGLNKDLIDGIETRSTIRFRQGATSSSGDELGRAFLNHIEGGVDIRPSRLYDDEHQLPTVLSFPAMRRVVRPPEDEKAIRPPPNFGYRPLQVFENDGTDWSTSLSNILLWMHWLDDGRYEELQDLVERSVLTNGHQTKALGAVNRPSLMPLITSATGQPHRLDRLSHGERSLFQILARIAMHMTGNTFVVIDELELHLHPNWSLGLLKTLKSVVATRPVSVIFTTHSPELIRAFAHEQEEDGLRKGGHIIEIEELADG